MRFGMFVLAVAALAMGACDSGSSSPAPEPTLNLSSGNSSVATAVRGAAEAEETIQIQTMAGGPKEKATLLPTKSGLDLAGIGQAIRESDLACENALAARQLSQNGKALDIYKIDCSGDHSYQITMMNGEAFYKPWTGVILGN